MLQSDQNDKDWPSETRNTNGGDENYKTLIEKLEGVSLGKCMSTAQVIISCILKIMV